MKNDLKIKPMTVSDVGPDYLEWLTDYEVVKYTEQRWEVHSIESITHYVNTMDRSSNDFLYGIFVDDLMIGSCKIGSINWCHLTGEISFILGNKEYWGLGIGTKSVDHLIKIAREQLRLSKVTGGIYSSNHGSRRVFEKNKFSLEGVLDSQIITENGREAALIYGLKLTE